MNMKRITGRVRLNVAHFFIDVRDESIRKKMIKSREIVQRIGGLLIKTLMCRLFLCIFKIQVNSRERCLDAKTSLKMDEPSTNNSTKPCQFSRIKAMTRSYHYEGVFFVHFSMLQMLCVSFHVAARWAIIRRLLKLCCCLFCVLLFVPPITAPFRSVPGTGGFASTKQSD